MRFFRSTPTVYEQVRATLDQAWSLPADNGTQTCIEPEQTAPHDPDGRVLLAVNDEFCGYSVAEEMLPQLLASGAVEELDAATYLQESPQIPVQ